MPQGHRPSWVDDRLFPFDSHWVDIGGHQVHHVDEGIGPTVLMLHGNPAWSFLYRHVITGLRDRFRCVVPDYPGFGLSRAAPGYGFRPPEHAAVVTELVRRLDLKDVTLVAGDWGGPIGLSVAAAEPERFARLVLTNTWAWPVDGDRRLEWFAGVVGGRVGTWAIRRFDAFVNVLVPLGHARNRPTRAEMRHFRGPFPTPSSRRPTAIFPRSIVSEQVFLADVQTGLTSISHLPLTLVWGGRDVAFRSRERERFEALFPDHETVTVPDAGHFVADDAPEELIRAIGATRG